MRPSDPKSVAPIRRHPLRVHGHAVLRIPQPDRIERAYLSGMEQLVETMMTVADREWQKLMRVYGEPWNEALTQDSMIQDAFDFKAIISVWKRRVAIGYAQAVAETPEALVRAFTKQLDLFNQEQLGQSFEAVVGVRPFVPELKNVVSQATQENVDLIVRMPSELLDRLEGKVIESVSRGRRHESFSQVVQETLGVGKRRANLIARDQTAKLNGRLNEERQKAAGIDKYIWTTVKDDRVVGTPGGMYPEGNDKHGNHYEREGKVFLWSEPPHDGHPGQPINCRCRALPVVDDLLDQQDRELRRLIGG